MNLDDIINSLSHIHNHYFILLKKNFIVAIKDARTKRGYLFVYFLGGGECL